MSSTMDIHRCRFVDYTPHTVTALAFSHASAPTAYTPDLRLAVGRSNGDIEIWNPKYNWSHELTLSGGKGRSIEGLCWVTTEEYPQPRLFSIGGSTYVTEWDLSTGLPKINYDCNTGVIWAIAASKNGQSLAVGCDDGSVAIIDISGGFGSLEHGFICQRQDSRVLALEWYENDMIVGGCADARIRCWSASKDTKGRILNTMRVDKSKTESTLVWSVTVLPKRKQIVSGDSTGSVKIWDLNSFTLLQTFQHHEADVLCLTVDDKEEKLFSAGVDRKIHHYSLITQNKNRSSKWVHTFNRLLHSNDIRAMTIFENTGYNFLVSGGVEKSVVIQSVDQFHDGKYRKLMLAQQKSNTLVSGDLVVMHQDQSVKIWRVQKEDQYKLVCKLTLSDDDNISSVSLNEDNSVLAVSTITSVKVFELLPTGSKLIVNKFRDEQFDSLVSGAKKVILFKSKLAALTPSDELYLFDVDIENKKIELDTELEFADSSLETKSKLTYINCIKYIVINKSQDKLAVSRFNGSIEIVSLTETFTSYALTKLMDLPHLIQFTDAENLVVVTEDNKLYEFHTKKSVDGSSVDSLLTAWSKRNSEFLPKQFLTLEDKPQGVFVDGSRVWVYGFSWICFFDLSINIPINKVYKNTGVAKKRNRDGLSIEEDLEEDEEEDVLALSLKQSEINRLRHKIQADENGNGSDVKPFWITNKYRSILRVDKFQGKDLIIIERPLFSLPNTPAFDLPKIRV